LYDVGEENDQIFLVMEHIEGEILLERLKKGPPWPTVVSGCDNQGR
jgi:hypothetical protein